MRSDQESAVREIRTLRLTWRGLETWPWWNCDPTLQSKERDWKPSTYRRRACPRPYLGGGRRATGAFTRNWTAVRHQRHHKTDRLRGGPQAIEGRPFCGGEGLVALRAHEASVLARVDPNVALAGLASGRTCQVGAEYGSGVHD